MDARVRASAFSQRGHTSIALRMVPRRVPSLAELGMPAIITELTRMHQGLILITGPTGSGKTTTLAAMINQINNERACHIITIEDPIEYVHDHNLSIVNQREVGRDTDTFGGALRAALRSDPDVVLVGEMRDLESIAAALTIAETGHLVLATLHTNDAAQTPGPDHRRLPQRPAGADPRPVRRGAYRDHLPATDPPDRARHGGGARRSSSPPRRSATSSRTPRPTNYATPCLPAARTACPLWSSR